MEHIRHCHHEPCLGQPVSHLLDLVNMAMQFTWIRMRQVAAWQR
jgi:hypothetical protein